MIVTSKILRLWQLTVSGVVIDYYDLMLRVWACRLWACDIALQLQLLLDVKEKTNSELPQECWLKGGEWEERSGLVHMFECIHAAELVQSLSPVCRCEVCELDQMQSCSVWWSRIRLCKRFGIHAFAWYPFFHTCNFVPEGFQIDVSVLFVLTVSWFQTNIKSCNTTQVWRYFAYVGIRQFHWRV